MGWRSLPIVALALAGGLLVALACQSTTGPAEGKGQLTVLLTDAPFPFELVSEANVTISRVDVVTRAGIETIMEEEATFNLLDLQDGVTAILAQDDVTAGNIAQIRLIVTVASVVLVDGTTFDLTVPSGAQTGIKVLLPPGFLQVEEGGQASVTLDFDVSDSFIVQGNPDTPAGIRGFIFKPVVKPMGVSNGTDDDEEEEEENGENGE